MENSYDTMAFGLLTIATQIIIRDYIRHRGNGDWLSKLEKRAIEGTYAFTADVSDEIDTAARNAFLTGIRAAFTLAHNENLIPTTANKHRH